MSDEVGVSSQTQELLEEAREAKDSLRERLVKQATGELGEDETRLSAEEINEKTEQVEQLFREAKALERMDSLEAIAERAAEDPDSVNPALRSVFSEMADTGGKADEGESDAGRRVFKDTGHFLRAIAAREGLEGIDHDLTPEEMAKFSDLQKGHDEFNRGDRYDESIVSGDELKQAVEEKVIGGGGGSTTGGADLVPNVHMEELLRVMGEEQVFVNRARQIPMQRRTVDFPRLDQTDNSNTRPLHSIAAVSIINEGAQIDRREPSFSQFTLTAHKYAAYLEITNELLAESIVDTQPIVTELLTSAIAYEWDRHALSAGTGNSQPQSALGSNATINEPRKTANQINPDDIFDLEKRFFGTDGVYYFHPSVLPQLANLVTDNIIVWNPDLRSDVPGTLMGREMERTAKLNLLGDLGDLFLADPSFYIAGTLQQMSVATSTDFKFRNDLLAIRAIFRAAGAPWLDGKISQEASGGAFVWEQSPFVALSQAVES